MSAIEILHELQEASKDEYLILAKLFKLVFGRDLRITEWGFFRKLVNIYGYEIVYYALLGSVHISGTGTPLAYVSKVCMGILQEQTTEPTLATPGVEATKKIIDHLKSYTPIEVEDELD